MLNNLNKPTVLVITLWILVFGGLLLWDSASADVVGTSTARTTDLTVEEDPFTTIRVCDDFVGQGSSTSLGVLNWANAALNGGTLGSGAISAIRINSHATNDNSGYAMILQPSQTTAAWGTGDWRIDAVFTPGANGTAITSIGFYLGVSQGLTAPGDGEASSSAIRIRYNTDHSDTTYMFQVCDSTTSGCGQAGDATNNDVEASTIAPVAGNPNRFRIRRAASGVGGNPTLYFRVDDEPEKTFCASGCNSTDGNMSSTSVAHGVQYLTRTTTGVLSGDLDLYCFYATNFSARY